MGIKVIRFKNEDIIHRLDKVVSNLRNELTSEQIL